VKPADNEVLVSYLDIAGLGDASTTTARAWLRDEEHARFTRYRHDDDRMMFLAGRVMARSIVGDALGCAPTSWRWREGPHGRPEIDEPGTELRFNIAHSARLVACAVADGRDVGVDVEDRERPETDRQIVTRYCSPAEAADIDEQGDAWHDRFLIYWTLKEAYLKARGLGISVHLSDISFTLDGDVPRIGFIGSLADHDPRWTFSLMRPTARHLVAIASEGDGPVAHRLAPFDLSALAADRPRR